MKRMLLRQSGRVATVLLSVVILYLMIPYAVPAAEPALQLSEDGITQERANGRMWQMDRSKRLRTTTEVDACLATLNRGKYNDWRLPTRQELFELFGIFDLKENGEVKFQLEGGYWLVNQNGEIEVGAWEIGDQCGPSRTYFTKKVGYVRAVRP